MQEFLQHLMQLPTLFFTAMLGISLLYWLLIIVGAADLNPFDGAEGAIKGGVEGAAKGAVEGAVKSVTGGAGGVAEHADGAAAVKASAFQEALAFLGLTKVPVTISFSLFSLFAWFIAYATRFALDPILPNVLSALAATGASIFGGLAVTSFITKPLSGLFKESYRPGGKGLIGRTVKVTTEIVDATRGQGEIDDGAGGITVTIRCEKGSLKRGDECVILEADPEAGLYWVEPVGSLFTNTPLAETPAAQEVASGPAVEVQAVANGSTDRKPS